MQVRHERAEHIPAAHACRVARLDWPPPAPLAPDSADPQRAARGPRRRLCVVRRGHRHCAWAWDGEENGVRGDAEIPGEWGKADGAVHEEGI